MNQDDITSQHDDDEEEISRTQIKREALELQVLGEQLVTMSLSHLAFVPMEDELDEAVMLARRLTSNEAKRRQIQFIGKLMRKYDLEPIHAGLAKIKHQSQMHGINQQQTNQWCDKFKEQGPAALEDFLQRYPNGDRQQLRQIIRQVQKEAAAAKTDTQAKKLFRLIRDLIQQS